MHVYAQVRLTLHSCACCSLRVSSLSIESCCARPCKVPVGDDSHLRACPTLPQVEGQLGQPSTCCPMAACIPQHAITAGFNMLDNTPKAIHLHRAALCMLTRTIGWAMVNNFQCVPMHIALGECGSWPWLDVDWV